MQHGVGLSTATRTVAFTDLANYTARVARTDREGLRKILIEHEGLVGPTVGRYGGRIVKNLGDSFMILFDSATDALKAAFEIQRRVDETGELSLRMAMTTGDMEEMDGDAFGDAVNLAARILSKTPAGETWFGPGTRVCMNAAEIPWESVGRFTLKGIPGMKEVFRAVPPNRAWLPERVRQAVESSSIVRFERGARPPLLSPNQIVLLEGFAPGSPALLEALDGLPRLDPSNLFLVTYNIASADRGAWVGEGRGIVIATPQALNEAIDATLRAVTRTSGSDTIVLDAGIEADMELMIYGLALPAVPLSDVVSSYFFDLSPDGRWVNTSDHALLRAEVSQGGVRIRVMSPGVVIGGRGIATGEEVPLQHGMSIQTPGGLLMFEEANNGYAGLLLSESDRRLSVAEGQTAFLGRAPEQVPGLHFPERKGRDNLRWCSGPKAASARAQSFTLDRALAGRTMASVQLQGSVIHLRPLHPRLPTYVARAGSKTLQVCDRPLEIAMGDRIVAGTAVVLVRKPLQDMGT
jgi:class 3 adenylate cyclase